MRKINLSGVKNFTYMDFWIFLSGALKFIAKCDSKFQIGKNQCIRQVNFWAPDTLISELQISKSQIFR